MYKLMAIAVNEQLHKGLGKGGATHPIYLGFVPSLGPQAVLALPSIANPSEGVTLLLGFAFGASSVCPVQLTIELL